MQLVFMGLAILVGGGVVAPSCSSTARLANWVGGLIAIGGSLVAAVPAFQVLNSGKLTVRFSRPWQLPFASFSIQGDSLSAWFAAIFLRFGAWANTC